MAWISIKTKSTTAPPNCYQNVRNSCTASFIHLRTVLQRTYLWETAATSSVPLGFAPMKPHVRASVGVKWVALWHVEIRSTYAEGVEVLDCYCLMTDDRNQSNMVAGACFYNCEKHDNEHHRDKLYHPLPLIFHIQMTRCARRG